MEEAVSTKCAALAASSVSVRRAACAALILACGCGGTSTRSAAREDGTVGGASGALGGAGGESAGAAGASGFSGGGAGGVAAGHAGASGAAGASGSAGTDEPAEPVCVLGDARCNAAFRREVCDAEGWKETTFVCARTVAVSDEDGSYCVTKGDGSYRCWGGEAGPALDLPPDDYVRVQRAMSGLTGLTEDGRLVAPNFLLPSDLPPVVAFRATNMWGNHGVCPQFADGSFMVMTNEYDLEGVLGVQIRETVGPVRSAGCFFEGFAAAVLSDGSIWTRVVDPPPGNDFVEVTMSVNTMCAIKTSGAVACVEPYSGCTDAPGLSNCVGPDLPRFPEGRYHSLTSTYDAVCAIDQQDTLLCRRADGADMPIEGGPYLSAEGGHDVLCAIRRDGTTACFRQDGLYENVSAFVPVDPPVDAGW